MSTLRTSKTVAWIAFAVVILAVILAVCLPGYKQYWWETLDIFFAFMMVFSHLAALYIARMSADASKKLDLISLLFGILAIISFIVIFVIDQL